jgi:reactive intermediate/imine deaminase
LGHIRKPSAQEILFLLPGRLGWTRRRWKLSRVGSRRQVLNNLKHVLEAAGSELGCVVKTIVFLTDMANFAAMNAIYNEYFSENPPARSTVAVAALPKGGLVEIEIVALLK